MQCGPAKLDHTGHPVFSDRLFRKRCTRIENTAKIYDITLYDSHKCGKMNVKLVRKAWIYNVRCMFIRNKRHDASARQMADVVNDKI